MKLLKLCFSGNLLLVFYTLSAGVTAQAAADEPVYAVCTVRDIIDDGERYTGKLYRSAVFVASATYDSDISLTPEKAGRASAAFEKWVWQNHGLSADRTAISKGSEHYCVEAALTPHGRATLTQLAEQWDTATFPNVKLVLTDWSPSLVGKTQEELAPEQAGQALRTNEEHWQQVKAQSDAAIAARRAALAEYERGVSAAKAAREQFARDKAAHEEEVARARSAREDYEHRRRAYEEDYKRMTGRSPPE